MDVRKCPVCGRGDLLQAQIRTVQCLGCGSVLDTETGLEVVTTDKATPQSASGAVVVELNTSTTPEPEVPVVAPATWTYPSYGGDAA